MRASVGGYCEEPHFVPLKRDIFSRINWRQTTGLRLYVHADVVVSWQQEVGVVIPALSSSPESEGSLTVADRPAATL